MPNAGLLEKGDECRRLAFRKLRPHLYHDSKTGHDWRRIMNITKYGLVYFSVKYYITNQYNSNHQIRRKYLVLQLNNGVDFDLV